MTPTATFVIFVTGTGPAIDRPKTSAELYSVNERITKIHMWPLKRVRDENTGTQTLVRTHDDLDMIFRLDDENLREHDQFFDEYTCENINIFLRRQEQPVCLIAHDGHRFHYRVLKTHFDRFGRSLPDNILCADSLRGFFELLDVGVVINPEADTAPRPYSELVKDPFFAGHPWSGAPYNLEELYSREIGDRVEHHSEVRCLKLYRLIVMYCERFVEWADRNRCHFSEVPRY